MKLALFALAVATGLGLVTQPIAEYTVIDETGQPMRAQFNADSGKVRVIMLVAPT